METASSLKRSTQAELSLCIICQQPKKDKMLSMGQQGVQKLRESATKRHKLKDIKNRDVTDRILHAAFNESLKCHKSCYAWFTDKGKIARLESKSPHAVSSCSASSHMSQLRSSTKPLLWELCMFFQTESKRETLRSVQT